MVAFIGKTKVDSMMSESIVVLIPVYKSALDELETQSFEQCILVLRRHHFSICTYSGLDISFYTQRMEKEGLSFSIDCFDKSFFRSTEGYNELHLSFSFYQYYRRRFDYMLVYQLDAFVFEDKLDDWVKKGYDYVGSPWFSDDGRELLGVGNGGFCLKRIGWWHKELKSPFPLLKMSELIKKYPIRGLRSLFRLLTRLIGYKNNLNDCFIKNKFYNEDYLPAFVKKYGWYNVPKIPEEKEAAYFAFERFPKKLYEMTSFTLPMGCHAWWKNDPNFWKQFIE